MAPGALPDGSGGPHLLVTDVEAPRFDDDTHHHATRVLRLRDGDALTVTDGAGRWRPCRLGDGLEPTGAVVSVAAPDESLTVAFSLIKGGRPELVVQKLTELGVDRIVPVVSARSVVRWDDSKRTANAERFRRVAREALQQSRGVRLPEIGDVVGFGELAARGRLARADFDGEGFGPDVSAVVIGPEGGFDDAERALVPTAVSLGATVLRAETAAIVAGALMCARRSGLVTPSE